jgi:YYY domain-containing protein
MFGELLNELPAILTWYVIFLILGLATLPIINKYFHNWKDKGYGVSKFIGLAMVTLPLWFLSAIHVVPFTQYTTILFFFAYVGFAGWLVYKNKYRLTKSEIKWIIFEELMCFFIFIIWTFIRSTNSQVEGTEKMMNIAFMNSILRTEFFPALDPWQSGGTINYYHLGHYMYVFVAKMVGIKISFAYNFALNIIAGFSFIAAFSIIVKLINTNIHKKASVLAGLFGASWLCFGSNMHYLYKWAESIYLNKPFEYWFPDGTRIIENAIDEFPAYSIPLGDLHGHYIGMPFLIVMIALLIVSYNIAINSKDKIRFNMIISVLVVALYGINSWDFITVNFLFVLLHLYQSFSYYKNIKDRLIGFIIAESSLLIVGIIFILPYILNFHPPVGGLGIVPMGATSDLLPWTQMWGMFLIISLFFIYVKFLAQRNKWIQFIALFFSGIIFSVPILNSLEFIIKTQVESSNNFDIKISEKFWPNMLTLFLVLLSIGVISYVIIFLTKKIKDTLKYKVGKYEIFVFILNVAVFALLIGVEFLFIKDIFYRNNPPYFRTNTVFKFYYHAWIIWTIVCSYYVYKIFVTFLDAKIKAYKFIGLLISSVIVILYYGSIMYIFEGVRDFYPFFKYDNINYPTVEQLFSRDAGDHIKIYDSIDGNMYIKRTYEGDYEAMKWFNENVKGQPVIVEAVGDAYTYYARFSANLGLVDIMGWPTHEWQWRSSITEVTDENGKTTYPDAGSTEAFARRDEVQKIYTTVDADELKDLLIKYDVKYVVVGVKERDMYTDKLNEVLFAQFGSKVYDNLDTRIYKIKFTD